MDIYNLAATNIHPRGNAAPMGARAEDLYYGSSRIELPRLSPGLLRSIAMTAGVILIIGITLI